MTMCFFNPDKVFSIVNFGLKIIFSKNLILEITKANCQLIIGFSAFKICRLP
jgi:hypothetical protein